MNLLASPSTAFAAWIVQTSWQAAILTVLILLAQKLSGERISPAWRHRLWLLLVFRLLLPFSLPAPTSIFNFALWQNTTLQPTPIPPPETAVDYSPISARPPSEPPAIASIPVPAQSIPATSTRQSPPASPLPEGTPSRAPLNLWSLAFLVWLSGLCFFLARFAWMNCRFTGRIKTDKPVVDARVLAITKRCLCELGISSRITPVESRHVQSPAVYGLFRKVMLLPEGMAHRFSDEELRCVVLHELAHVKRRDLELIWLTSLLQIVHWFNPFVWLAFARMRADREMATDALALSVMKNGTEIDYGEAILKVLESVRCPLPIRALAGIVENKKELSVRLQAISTLHRRKFSHRLALVLMLALASMALTDGVPEKNSTAPATRISAAPLKSVLPPNASQTFEIRFIDENEKPLTGIPVHFEFEYFELPSKAFELLTDKDGTAKIPLPGSELVEAPLPVVRRVTMKAQPEGYRSLFGVWGKSDAAFLKGTCQIKLPSTGEIGGRIVDEQGRPVPNAQVLVNESSVIGLPFENVKSPWGFKLSPFSWHILAGEAVATTDAAGRWNAPELAPSARWAALRIRHPDFSDVTYSTPVYSNAGDGVVEDPGKRYFVEYITLAERTSIFVLPRGITLRGKVQDESGNPVAPVTVRYSDSISENSFTDFLAERTLLTDTQGGFRIDHVSGKHLYIAIQQEGFAPCVAELDPSNQSRQIAVILEKGKPVRLKVTDLKGSPLAGAKVEFLVWGKWHGIHWSGTTDPSGSLEWPNAPGDNFRLRIEREDYLPSELTCKPGEHVVRLRSPLRLSGSVTDLDTGKVIPKFRLIWASSKEALERGQDTRTIEFIGGRYSVDLAALHDRMWGDHYPHAFNFRIEADSYTPRTSREFRSRERDEGEIVYNLQLAQPELFVGTILDKDGKPVPDAEVMFKSPTSPLFLKGQPHFENQSAFTTSDSGGVYNLIPNEKATHLLAVHEKGYSFVERAVFITNSTLRLIPWGRVEGTVWNYDKIEPNAEVILNAQIIQSPSEFRMVCLGKADETGHFSINYVPGLACTISKMIPNERGRDTGPANMLTLSPGETSRVKVGGSGRPVIGGFEVVNPYVAIKWKWGGASATALDLKETIPADFQTAQEKKRWLERVDVKAASSQQGRFPIFINADGSFRAEELPPGKYRLELRAPDPRDGTRVVNDILNHTSEFTVPESPEANSRTPFDTGAISVRLKKATLAYPFEARDLNEKIFRLTDFRGKFVVVNVWASWCTPCVAELPLLRKAQQVITNRADFVLIGLNMDKSIDDLRSFLKKNEVPGLQLFVGPWVNGQLPRLPDFGEIPSSFIIDKEGRFLAERVPPSRLADRLEQLLSKPDL